MANQTLQSPVSQAQDRLDVLKRIEELERAGIFDVDVEEDPPAPELLPDQIDYLREKFSSRVKTWFSYRLARRFLNKIIAEKQMIVKEIRNIENFQQLNTGAIITCNHFNAFDSFAIQMVYEAAKQPKRTFFRVIREGNYTNFPGFYGILMRNCNTFPLSSNPRTMQKFLKSMDQVLRAGHYVLVYPEQSMWWNYRKPKPLKDGAFRFAVRSGVPVLPCFITMADSDILGADGFYVQEYTVHVGQPIYPDPQKSRAQNIREMRQNNYDQWVKTYEQTYGIPLRYLCDE